MLICTFKEVAEYQPLSESYSVLQYQFG